MHRELNKINEDLQKLRKNKTLWKKATSLFSANKVKGEIQDLRTQLTEAKIDFLVSPGLQIQRRGRPKLEVDHLYVTAS